MCNLSDMIEERGMQQGLQQGVRIVKALSVKSPEEVAKEFSLSIEEILKIQKELQS